MNCNFDWTALFYEQIELQVKLLNYFLGSNKSNINQSVHVHGDKMVIVIRPTHNPLLHLALERSVRGLECTQHSVHSKS